MRLRPGIFRGPRASGRMTASHRDTASFQKVSPSTAPDATLSPLWFAGPPSWGQRSGQRSPHPLQAFQATHSCQHMPAAWLGHEGRQGRCSCRKGRNSPGTRTVHSLQCLMCTYYASHCCWPERNIKVQKKNKICSHGANHSNNQTDHKENKTLANRKHQIIKQL